jgi:DNA-binding FadR family transcriptional regulator
MMDSSSEDGGRTATETVVAGLADLIVGRMRPGDQLPSEAELAERFSVSRLTVREAVRMLAGRGLLELSRGRRAVVREPDGTALSDFLASQIRGDPKVVFDLIELRMSLETLSTRLAARRASRAGIQALERAMAGMRESAAKLKTGPHRIDAEAEATFHAYDLSFHETLATISGNRILAFLFEAMSSPLRESFQMSRRGQSLRGHSHEKTVNFHQGVLDAVRRGDEEAAAEAMRTHLSETERDIRAHFSNAS